MQIRCLVLIFFVTFFLASCAGFNEGQPPAPVFGGQSAKEPNSGAPDNPGQTAHQPPQVIETKPLEGLNKAPEMVEIKPELPPPVETLPTQPDGTQDNPLEQPAEPTSPFGAVEPSENQALPETEPPAGQPKPNEIVKPVAPQAPETPKEPEALVPLETFAQQSPAVGSLVTAANENSQGGNLDSAVASIERAIRIEPRNATLYYKLAVLRLRQSKPRLAEDIARKAVLLAVNENALKKHSWLLIANARALQKNVEGFKKAKAEAAKY